MKEIRSGNGINFVVAEKEIRESLHRMNYRKLENGLMQRDCKWVFTTSPPPFPWGIAYVRGMGKTGRTVKRSLKVILGKEPMNEEVL